jgi:hypothetical protein
LGGFPDWALKVARLLLSRLLLRAPRVQRGKTFAGAHSAALERIGHFGRVVMMNKGESVKGRRNFDKNSGIYNEL